MIIDCSLFFNEVDLLEIRLCELSDIVDLFVIGEGVETFTGEPKELVRPHEMKRFAPWKDKIHHVVVPAWPGNKTRPSAMEVDAHQKQYAAAQIPDGDDDDAVILTDGDEIARNGVVVYGNIHIDDRPVDLGMHLSYYYLNYPQKDWVRGAKMVRRRTLINRGYDVAAIRRDFSGPQWDDCGWHFSYLYDIQRKMNAWGHQELNHPPFNDAEHIAECKRTGKDLYGRSHLDGYYTDDLSWLPRCVQDNPQRYSHLLRSPT